MSDIKTLFSAYEVADEELQAAKKIVEDKERLRSEAVKAILTETGSKGPYNYKGQQLKIVIRGSAKGTTYFFRGSNKNDIINIE